MFHFNEHHTRTHALTQAFILMVEQRIDTNKIISMGKLRHFALRLGLETREIEVE